MVHAVGASWLFDVDRGIVRVSSMMRQLLAQVLFGAHGNTRSDVNFANERRRAAATKNDGDDAAHDAACW